jgi:hypothetical protein
MGSVVAAIWRDARGAVDDGIVDGPELRWWHVSPGARAAATPRRTLHLVDLENLCGGTRATPAEAVAALNGYLAAAGWRADDHVVIAAHPSLVLAVGFARPVPSRYLPAVGTDAADLALLADLAPSDAAARYDRVVIGSGDHAFGEYIGELAELGVDVSVVARPRCVSHELFVHRARLGLPIGGGTVAADPTPTRPLATRDFL